MNFTFLPEEFIYRRREHLSEFTDAHPIYTLLAQIWDTIYQPDSDDTTDTISAKRLQALNSAQLLVTMVLRDPQPHRYHEHYIHYFKTFTEESGSFLYPETIHGLWLAVALLEYYDYKLENANRKKELIFFLNNYRRELCEESRKTGFKDEYLIRCINALEQFKKDTIKQHIPLLTINDFPLRRNWKPIFLMSDLDSWATYTFCFCFEHIEQRILSLWDSPDDKLEVLQHIYLAYKYDSTEDKPTAYDQWFQQQIQNLQDKIIERDYNEVTLADGRLIDDLPRIDPAARQRPDRLPEDPRPIEIPDVVVRYSDNAIPLDALRDYVNSRNTRNAREHVADLLQRLLEYDKGRPQDEHRFTTMQQKTISELLEHCIQQPETTTHHVTINTNGGTANYVEKQIIQH